MPVNNGLRKYLLKNPWPEEFYGLTQIDNIYNYTIELPSEHLWQILSGTTELNSIPGLRIISYQETNGKLYGKGKISFFHNEWEEKPWEWETGRDIKFTRIFSKGIISYSRIHFIFDSTENNITSLTVYSGYILRNFNGYITLKMSEKIFKQKFKNLLKAAESGKIKNNYINNSEGLEKYAISNNSENYKLHGEILDPVRDYLLGHGIELSIIYRLLNYIINHAHSNQYRIRPKVLSKILDIEFEKILSAILYSCRYGLLDLSWNIVCPYCRVVKEIHTHLNTIKDKSRCEVCRTDIEVGDLNSIEAVFSVKKDLKKSDRKSTCNSEPFNKPHILLQKILSPGSNYTYIIPEIDKQLRFRTGSNKFCGLLDVAQNVSSKNLYWDELNIGTVHKCSPGSTIFINNTEQYEEQYIIEVSEDDPFALRPSEFFSFHEFREVFPDEAVAEGMTLDIGIQNIVMVDIADSTSLYSRSGDNESFSIIRQYFLKIYDIVKLFNGAVIKKTGNTVMLSFLSPLDALRCSIKLVLFFDGRDRDIPVIVRISINRGPCHAVNLDAGIDYFGKTIDVTSRLLNFTFAGEIALTEDFILDTAVNSYLNDKHYSFKNIERLQLDDSCEIFYRKIKIKKKLPD